jgi:hypothetical protein
MYIRIAYSVKLGVPVKLTEILAAPAGAYLSAQQAFGTLARGGIAIALIPSERQKAVQVAREARRFRGDLYE